MSTRNRLGGILALAVITATLAGCDMGHPEGDPTVRPPGAITVTPAPTVTPTEDPLAPSFIVIDAHQVGVGANNQSSLIQIPYTTDIATAADQLSAAIGARPVVTPIPATSCAPATATYDWGGLVFSTTVPFDEPGGGAFVATVSAVHTSGGLALESAFGQQVGMQLTDVLAHVPGSMSGDRGEDHIEALVDPQDDNSWGVIMPVEDGAVTSFYAPGLFLIGHGTCG